MRSWAAFGFGKAVDGCVQYRRVSLRVNGGGIRLPLHAVEPALAVGVAGDEADVAVEERVLARERPGGHAVEFRKRLEPLDPPDGLAGGKGVVLAATREEALDTLRAFMDGQFGAASRTVVLEEPLVGMELSLHVLVDVAADHAAYAVLPPCQDHKRIFDGDRGPNTGGMGAFGPLPFLRPEDLERLRVELVEPTVQGLRQDGLWARGVLFLGVMWTARGPMLLEYNVRFGDPETQVLMELLDEDLAALLLEVAEGRLARTHLALRPGCAITVVLAAQDYPEGARKDVPITLGEATGVKVIHAGTRREQGRWLTHGGRVLNLVTRAPDLAQARDAVAAALPEVHWPGMQVRSDIGLRALNHARAGLTVADPFL